MLDDLKWATYLLRFCTQILYMAFLYKTLHFTLFLGSKFLLVCFSMHNVYLLCWFFFLACGQTHFDQKKTLNLIPRSGLIFGPYLVPNTCVDTGLLSNRYVIIDNILVSKN